MTPSPTAGPRVGLFATCLMNLFRPNVGFSAVKLLEDAGCSVEVPASQTCCGQPGYNSGDYDAARALARQVIEAFEHFDYVVGPSGSCMATIRHDYPALFAGDAQWLPRAEALSRKSFELLSFLADVRGAAVTVDARYAGTATYHDSCSGLRGLGIKGQPRALLGEVDGLKVKEMEDSEVCCGFGGTFCVKYPEISEKMVDDKVRNILATGADTLLGGDLGCLMNIAGRLKRINAPVKVYHAAEVLAGFADGPGLADAPKESR
ncbi:(Fe-S)-binding protein [Aromatoleum anaerobium]|uniref:(Fe-S)-binding protein n=1 Tax=Aromatoleum anaerobium TaxID=182180 RepID=A0ABX1PJD4_9RHOO|nr:(Fe-S)-binding protein [Aromatoleum anaerobium]MCK0507080.1 (Fe-S)-binding protein [Aromatoleum anaerobium]